MDLLEIVDPSSSRGQGRRMYQAYKGQVDLSVYINSGMLTVHVVQAKELVVKATEGIHLYVTVSLIPDSRKKIPIQTSIVQDTSAPYWDTKFSFELTKDCKKKRLLVTVWNRDGDKRELIGCTSFGLHSIDGQRVVAEGWYYLLSEHLGQQKRLQVSSASDDLDQTVASTTSLAALWKESHTIAIRRTDKMQSFGFSMVGSCPVLVSKVKPDLPAEAAGVKQGDQVVMVNEVPVSGLTADSVARLVKHSGKEVVLGIRRFKEITQLEKSPWKPKQHSAPSCPDALPAKIKTRNPCRRRMTFLDFH